MDIKRKKRTRLYRDIVVQVRNLIQEGVLTPGDQLLPERQLAEKLGVSRSALREALTALDAMGLIVITPGGGTYIKKVSMESMVDPLACIMLKERETVFDFLETRKILESEIVKLAAERSSKSDLHLIKEAAVNMLNDVNAGRDADDSDEKFHIALARATQNSVLYNTIVMLTSLTREAYAPVRKELLSGPIKTWCEQNFQIYEAIKNNEPVKASRIIKKHLQTAEDELRRLINSNEEENMEGNSSGNPFGKDFIYPD